MIRYLILLVIVVPLVWGQNKCDPNNLNVCTSQLLQMARDNVPVPTTIEEVEGHCNNVRNASRCIRSYFRDCAPPSTKQMSRVVMSGISKKIKKNCSPYGMQEILKHTECMASVRGPLKQCYNQGVRDVYNIRMSSDKSKWHNLLCCYGSRAHNCVVNAVNQNCDAKEVDYFQRQATQFVDELFDSFCPSSLVWGKKECAELVSAISDNPLPKDKTVTVLPLLMDIVKEFSIDEEESI